MNVAGVHSAFRSQFLNSLTTIPTIVINPPVAPIIPNKRSTVKWFVNSRAITMKKTAPKAVITTANVKAMALPPFR